MRRKLVSVNIALLIIISSFSLLIGEELLSVSFVRNEGLFNNGEKTGGQTRSPDPGGYVYVELKMINQHENIEGGWDDRSAGGEFYFLYKIVTNSWLRSPVEDPNTGIHYDEEINIDVEIKSGKTTNRFVDIWIQLWEYDGGGGDDDISDISPKSGNGVNNKNQDQANCPRGAELFVRYDCQDDKIMGDLIDCGVYNNCNANTYYWANGDDDGSNGIGENDGALRFKIWDDFDFAPKIGYFHANPQNDIEWKRYGGFSDLDCFAYDLNGDTLYYQFTAIARCL